MLSGWVGEVCLELMIGDRGRGLTFYFSYFLLLGLFVFWWLEWDCSGCGLCEMSEAVDGWTDDSSIYILGISEAVECTE